MRSSSVNSSPKQKKFAKLRETYPFGEQSIDSMYEMQSRSRMGIADNSTGEKLPKTRIIKVKKRRKRVIKSTVPQQSVRPGMAATQDVQFMPQPNMLAVTQ